MLHEGCNPELKGGEPRQRWRDIKSEQVCGIVTENEYPPDLALLGHPPLGKGGIGAVQSGTLVLL